jgi:hypothetical protein
VLTKALVSRDAKRVLGSRRRAPLRVAANREVPVALVSADRLDRVKIL